MSAYELQTQDSGGCFKSNFTAKIRREGAIRQLADAEIFFCILMLCGSHRSDSWRTQRFSAVKFFTFDQPLFRGLILIRCLKNLIFNEKPQ